MGKIRHHEDLYQGEHSALVDAELFDKVQALLRRNYARGGSRERNRYGALLKGLLGCAPCGCGMMHTYSVRHQNRYRYYVCGHAQKRGWHTCPSKSVPAAEIEDFVVSQIRQLGPDPLKQVLTGAAAVRLPEDLSRAVDATALEEFDRTWEGLSTVEQAQVVRRLVERVEYDGGAGIVSVAFRPNGIETVDEEPLEEEAPLT